MNTERMRITTLTAIGLVGWLAPLGMSSKALQGFSMALGVACQSAACFQSKRSILSETLAQIGRENEIELIAQELAYQFESDLAQLQEQFFPMPQAPSPQAPSPQAPSPQAPSPQAPSPQAPSPQAALEGGHIHQSTIAPAPAPQSRPASPGKRRGDLSLPLQPNPAPKDWAFVENDLKGYFAVLLHGSQGSGKTTLANWLIQHRKTKNHSILVLDPHRELGQWQGCEVIGDGMDYASIDEKLEEILEMVRTRYKLRSQRKNADFPPITIVAEELTLWGEHCKNVSSFLKSALADFRKINLNLILIAHGKTNTILGGSKGTAATRQATFLEVNTLAEPDPTSASGVRPKGQALVLVPNSPDPILVNIPNLSTTTHSPIPPEKTVEALNRIFSEESPALSPTQLAIVDLSLAEESGWISPADAMSNPPYLSSPQEAVQVFRSLSHLEIGEIQNSPNANQLLFRAFGD